MQFRQSKVMTGGASLLPHPRDDIKCVSLTQVQRKDVAQLSNGTHSGACEITKRAYFGREFQYNRHCCLLQLICAASGPAPWSTHALRGMTSYRQQIALPLAQQGSLRLVMQIRGTSQTERYVCDYLITIHHRYLLQQRLRCNRPGLPIDPYLSVPQDS